MLSIVLYQPEIPPNTGNIIRLCANCGAKLHLIHPMGFNLDDRALRRAGLDYHEFADLQTYDNFEAFLAQVKSGRVIACSTKGARPYTDLNYREGDYLLFGPETRGLPPDIRTHENVSALIRIPMLEGSRSLNLSNSVAIITYEAWRQLGFPAGV